MPKPRAKKPGRVLFVTHKHPPSVGGMQRQSYELVRHYRQIGDASLIRYDSSYPIWLFFVIVVPWVWVRLLLERDIDAIHGNDALMGMFLTPFLLSGKKLYLTVHGLDVVHRGRIYQWWIRMLLPRFDGIAAVSAQTRDECIARGVSPDRVTFIPNASSIAETPASTSDFIDWFERTYGFDLKDKVIVSSVGRPVPRKGFSWFASQVLPKLPSNVVYLIVGPKEARIERFRLVKRFAPERVYRNVLQMNGVGTDDLKLRQLCKSEGWKNRLCLTGGLSGPRLGQLYAASTIFVMPNLKVDGDYEGFGLVAQEAIAHGALCLAADVDGIPSAVHDGQTGYLLPSGDADAWIRTIADLCADPASLGEQAERFQTTLRSRKYGWMEMTVRYKEYFERTAAGERLAEGAG